MDSVHQPSFGALHNRFSGILAVPTRDRMSVSRDYVSIVDMFLYGDGEKAYVINRTWVCVDSNNRITVFNAKGNTQIFIKHYKVQINNLLQ